MLNKKLLQPHIDLFKDFPDTELSAIKDMFKLESYRKGDYIVKENDKVAYVYYLQKGLLKLSYMNEQAKELIVSFATEFWWETDFMAFYNQSRAIFNLQCLEDTDVYCLHYQDYKKLVDKPIFNRYFLEKSLRGHITNQQRILSLLGMSPRERYEQFLELYPSLPARIPKSVLAQYLGLSRETLSRLYKNTTK